MEAEYQKTLTILHNNKAGAPGPSVMHACPISISTTFLYYCNKLKKGKEREKNYLGSNVITSCVVVWYGCGSFKFEVLSNVPVRVVVAVVAAVRGREETLSKVVENSCLAVIKELGVCRLRPHRGEFSVR